MKIGDSYTVKNEGGKSAKGRIVSLDPKSGAMRVRLENGRTVAIDGKTAKKAAASSEPKEKAPAPDPKEKDGDKK